MGKDKGKSKGTKDKGAVSATSIAKAERRLEKARQALEAERRDLRRAVKAAESAAARAEKAAASAKAHAKKSKGAASSTAGARAVGGAAPVAVPDPQAPAPAQPAADDPHAGLTRAQLVVLAGERGVPNRSRLTKALLLEALRRG